ncbi:hypothetical protein [Saccharopolyspora elongata]|uniref:Uncharacterized protein n=1 Tax=Saccharopolyspora elongata TaxID=2530387 RepID=A0A4R4Y9J2_9PSEU|nr:hypothetical protein [Saccharopolyspora elongata]TDD41181.1 hypothetical protein E1288_33495 [Saccharopolyspora elongata]
MLACADEPRDLRLHLSVGRYERSMVDDTRELHGHRVALTAWAGTSSSAGAGASRTACRNSLAPEDLVDAVALAELGQLPGVGEEVGGRWFPTSTNRRGSLGSAGRRAWAIPAVTSMSR